MLGDVSLRHVTVVAEQRYRVAAQVWNVWGKSHIVLGTVWVDTRRSRDRPYPRGGGSLKVLCYVGNNFEARCNLKAPEVALNLAPSR